MMRSFDACGFGHVCMQCSITTRRRTTWWRCPRRGTGRAPHRVAPRCTSPGPTASRSPSAQTTSSPASPASARPAWRSPSPPRSRAASHHPNKPAEGTRLPVHSTYTQFSIHVLIIIVRRTYYFISTRSFVPSLLYGISKRHLPIIFLIYYHTLFENKSSAQSTRGEDLCILFVTFFKWKNNAWIVNVDVAKVRRCSNMKPTYSQSRS